MDVSGTHGRDEAKEHEDEHFAQPEVTVGLGSSDIAEHGQQRCYADNGNDPAGDGDQVSPGCQRYCHDHRRADPYCTLSQQTRCHDPSRSDALLGIGPLASIEDVVDEVGGHLNGKSADQCR